MTVLKPGDVLIFQGANFITQLQGDTRAKHVAIVGKDTTRIWTTGATCLAWYGQVDAERYLAGKKYLVAETVQPLDGNQMDSIDSTCYSMINQFYGSWKFIQLELAASKTGFIPFLGKTPRPDLIIKRPICSQAVGCALWRAGVHVGAFLGKLDATALLPETFEQEARRNVLLRVREEV